jgi:hypothetical protein
MRRVLIWGALVGLSVLLASPASASPSDCTFTPSHCPSYGYQDDHDADALTMEIRAEGGYTGTVDYARQMANVICARRAEGYSQP